MCCAFYGFVIKIFYSLFGILCIYTLIFFYVIQIKCLAIVVNSSNIIRFYWFIFERRLRRRLGEQFGLWLIWFLILNILSGKVFGEGVSWLPLHIISFRYISFSLKMLWFAILVIFDIFSRLVGQIRLRLMIRLRCNSLVRIVSNLSRLFLCLRWVEVAHGLKERWVGKASLHEILKRWAGVIFRHWGHELVYVYLVFTVLLMGKTIVRLHTI